MKQVRKISNLVAEELEQALNESGVQFEEDVFESKVSEIVSAIDEAVDEAAKVDEGSRFFMATKGTKLGGVDVAEGEYVEVEETEDGVIVSVYDEEGELKESEIEADESEIEKFIEDAEELDDDDIEYDEEVEEGTKKCSECGATLDEEGNCPNCSKEVEEAKVHIKGGKKVKMTRSEILKKKAIAKGKKRPGMKWDGKKFVKMTAQEKQRAKKWAKKMHKGSNLAKAKKSMKKARKIAAGAASGTVSEAFDIHSDVATFTVEAGDVIIMENGAITVTRDGNTVLKGLEVTEGFMSRCVDEGVLVMEGESKKESENVSEEKVEEASILTFKAGSGYSLIKEGKELPMGNRVRARAILSSNGYKVTSSMLDSAANGEMVTL